MMFSSIRVKLTVWYIGVLALIMGAFAIAAYSIFVNSLKKEADENLAEMAKSFSDSAIGDKSDERGKSPDAAVVEALEEFRFRDYQFVIFSDSGRLISTTIDSATRPELEGSTGADGYGQITLDRRAFRVYTTPFRMQQHNYQLYALHAIDDQLALEERIRNVFYFAIPVLLFLAGFGGYFLARKALAPVSNMSDRAKRISAANLHERLPIANGKDELGNLAIVFNELLDRLDVEFDRQRRFMADASHELRTPLAIIGGESEVALLKDSRTSTEYQDSLRIVNDQAKRLTKIVEDLFTLARADSGELKPELREVYVDEVVAECVRSVRTLAEKRDVRIDFKSMETSIRGDETLLRRLFLNLLDNAVKYNVEHGTISINVGNNSVSISNTGEAIPEEHRASIFDRFYRVERSRTHRGDTLTSGAGLGLSISKRITDLHDGTLKYSRGEGGVNIFLVTFPSNQGR